MIVDVKCDDDTIQIANILQDVTTSEVEVKFLKRVKLERNKENLPSYLLQNLKKYKNWFDF